MKVRLTKSQIIQLYEIMGKNQKEDTDLYREIKDLLHLYSRVEPDKLLELIIENTEIEMVREMLRTHENEW